VNGATPGQAALAALVDGHFFGDGPHPLQLVCMTEDGNDVECNTWVSAVEPGVTWNELEHRMAEHARAHHFTAAVAAQQPQPAPGDVELLKRAADALWKSAKAALVVEHSLDKPYEDDPRWSPWTRWVERPAREAHDLAMVIRKRLKGAQQPQPAPGTQPRPGYVTVDARDIAIALNGYAGFTGDPVSFASELHERLRRTVFAGAAPEPQPAPELAAAMRESRIRAEVINDILSHFGPSGSGHTARVGQVQIAKWRAQAGLKP
jgi:hypothetical protein